MASKLSHGFVEFDRPVSFSRSALLDKKTQYINITISQSSVHLQQANLAVMESRGTYAAPIVCFIWDAFVNENRTSAGRACGLWMFKMWGSPSPIVSHLMGEEEKRNSNPTTLGLVGITINCFEIRETYLNNHFCRTSSFFRWSSSRGWSSSKAFVAEQ